jgi:hypothetical protein
VYMTSTMISSFRNILWPVSMTNCMLLEQTALRAGIIGGFRHRPVPACLYERELELLGRQVS